MGPGAGPRGAGRGQRQGLTEVRARSQCFHIQRNKNLPCKFRGIIVCWVWGALPLSPLNVSANDHVIRACGKLVHGNAMQETSCHHEDVAETVPAALTIGRGRFCPPPSAAVISVRFRPSASHVTTKWE